MKKYIIACCFCFVIILGTALNYLSADNKRSKEVNTTVNDNCVENVRPTDRYMQIKANAEKLSHHYKDVCGWINIENTNISYPLLLTTDNEYYIRRSYDGSYDKNGSIIVDYRLNKDLTENFNIILYGHNMASGNMFAYLSDPTSFTDAKIEIYSNNRLNIYRPYSAYIEGGNKFIKTKFKNAEEIKNYISESAAKSIVDFDMPNTEHPYILTLITCESSFALNDRRIVIHALRTDSFEF